MATDHSTKGDTRKSAHQTALDGLKVGGEMYRALSDLLAWADIQGMGGIDHGIPNGLIQNAETAMLHWRENLGIFS